MWGKIYKPQSHSDLKNAGGTELSVIVVSDVHLGDETSNYEDFSKFIDWIAAIEKEGGKTIKSGGKEFFIKPPEKLILLGDILELWSPRDNEPKYTLQESIEPFGKLVNLGCEKIFVLGNHDDDIAEYLNIKKKSSGIKENTFNINTTNFTIINRHYPSNPEDKEKGFLQVGKYKYFFIHGQQFDKLFIRFGPLAKIPTYTAKISNLVSENLPLKGWSIVLASIVFLGLSLGFKDNNLGFGINNLEFKNNMFLGFFWSSLVLSVPKIFTYLQDKIWAIFGVSLTEKPKNKNIQTIVKEKYYNIKDDTTDWDVNIVFGHTHVPEIRPYRPSGTGEGHEWLFLNAGSWTQEKGNYNTFVYLDEKGYYLFKWDQHNGIELIPPGETITD